GLVSAPAAPDAGFARSVENGRPVLSLADPSGMLLIDDGFDPVVTRLAGAALVDRAEVFRVVAAAWRNGAWRAGAVQLATAGRWTVRRVDLRVPVAWLPGGEPTTVVELVTTRLADGRHLLVDVRPV